MRQVALGQAHARSWRRPLSRWLASATGTGNSCRSASRRSRRAGRGRRCLSGAGGRQQEGLGLGRCPRELRAASPRRGLRLWTRRDSSHLIMLLGWSRARSASPRSEAGGAWPPRWGRRGTGRRGWSAATSSLLLRPPVEERSASRVPWGRRSSICSARRRWWRVAVDETQLGLLALEDRVHVEGECAGLDAVAAGAGHQADVGVRN